ncbi:MAG: ABC transporter ATP-binding protein [Maricaulaceae bacterium]
MSLTFKNISHSYYGVAALSAIDLTANSGEILSLLGPSGCGKTTLLNLTAGVLKVQTGEILLNGAPMASQQLNPPPEKRPVGLVFQEGALFPHLTVQENIAFGVADRSKHSALVGELLEQIGLEGFGARYPHTLSGGQQQRVALARALAPRPDVLLMDEPFANIDIILRRSLREETRRILRARDCTTILVTHDPDEAMEVSDHIAIMDDGKIAAYGTAQDLYRAPSSINVAMLTGGGTVLEGVFKGGEFISDFGRLPAASIAGSTNLTEGWSGALLARPQSLTLKIDSNGYEILDVRNAGPTQRVTIGAASSGTMPRGATSRAYLTIDTSPDTVWEIGQKVVLRAKGDSLKGLCQ